MGQPGHVRLDNQDRVRLVKVRHGVEARVQRMVLRKIQVRVELLEYGRAERFCEPHQCLNGMGITTRAFGDDDRIRGSGKNPRRFHHRFRRCDRCLCHGCPAWNGIAESRVLLAYHLARQAQVDGSLRLGMADGKGAIHDRLELQALARAQ